MQAAVEERPRPHASAALDQRDDQRVLHKVALGVTAADAHTSGAAGSSSAAQAW